MTRSAMSRRTLVTRGGAAVAGLSVLRLAGPARAFQSGPGGEVIPWLDQPEPNPIPDVLVRQLDWEQLDDWLTPPDQFFVVQHYGQPDLDEADWRLAVGGLVDTPMTLTLADLQARAREEVTFTLECSGNSAFPFNPGLVGNATWTGAPLAPLLEEAGVLDDGIEVVFWGADAGEQTWRDEITVTERFARSLSLADARETGALIAYEMNGAPLPPEHGSPARLIVPGWYGVANVKWLSRIEVRDARYQGHFMARDYVTIREEEHDGEAVWTFTSVGRARLKSAPAKVLTSGDAYRILGAAWGAPIAGVEVRIDDGPWEAATLTEGQGEAFAWTFWTLDWATPDPGEHTVTSRATAVDGEVQPAPDDPFLAAKRTLWESNGHITRRVRIA